MPKITVETIHTNPLTRKGDAPVEVEHTDRVEALLASGALREVPQPGPEPQGEAALVPVVNGDEDQGDDVEEFSVSEDENGDPLQD